MDDNRVDRFNQAVKDGNLKTAAHERAFKLRFGVTAEGFLKPWASTPREAPPLTPDDPDAHGRK